MNEAQQTNPYARQRGFFGSVKDLGTTTVKGTGLVVSDVVTVATDITGSTATITGVGRQAVSIWGENLLEDLQADQAIDRVHREIASLQQNSELTALKEELAKAKTSPKRGRPAKNTTTTK